MDKIKYDSPAALHHMNTLQMIINRMAINSATCKTWSIMLLSTIAFLFANTKASTLILLAFVPWCLFLCFDAYYLAMERRFRNDYKALAEGLRTEGIELAQLFEIHAASRKEQILALFCAMRSLSIWPVYGALGILLIAVHRVVATRFG